MKTKKLTKKQRKYLKEHFTKGSSVNEIAEKKGCSKQAVSQVIHNGLRNIRKEHVGV